MKQNHLRVSLVIPVYNEERHIRACLDAIARQSVKPFEVIVVDNNSTDDTAAICYSYPFVKLLSEKRQGVVFARDTGFDKARGEIIGRIDGDTIIDKDWVANVQRIFMNDDVSAVTGKVLYYDMAFSPALDAIDLYVRRWLARRLGREVAIQGANMAMRRSMWMKVYKSLCRRQGLHEDFDLAIHINQHGGLVVFDETLEVSLDFRLADADIRQFARYAFTSPRTYAQHGLRSRMYMYPVVWAGIIGYVPLKLLHRGYNTESGRFSWHTLLTRAAVPRVNPATFVD